MLSQKLSLTLQTMKKIQTKDVWLFMAQVHPLRDATEREEAEGGGGRTGLAEESDQSTFSLQHAQ